MKTLSRWFLALVSLAVGACSPVNILNGTIPRSGYTVTKDVAYGPLSRQKLDIYVPDSLSAPAPVILFFYGGSWRKGSKDDYLFVGEAFASKGFVAVVTDYRLYPEVMYPALLEDPALALQFVHEHAAEYSGRADAVFVAGHSAGAYNALMTALKGEKRPWLRGAIGLAGPYDFLPITDPAVIPIFAVEHQEMTQPIYYASHASPPAFLATGDEDEEVLPRNTKALAANLSALGRKVTTRIYPGVGHIGIVLALAKGFRGKAPVLDDIAAFVRMNSN